MFIVLQVITNMASWGWQYLLTGVFVEEILFPCVFWKFSVSFVCWILDHSMQFCQIPLLCLQYLIL